MRSSSATAIWIGVLVVLIVATSFLVRGIEASRSTESVAPSAYKSAPSLRHSVEIPRSTESIIPRVATTDFQLDPNESDTAGLSINARVEHRQRQLAETMQEIKNVHRQVSEAKANLAKAQVDEKRLPGIIKHFSDALVTLDHEIPAATAAIEAAKARLAEFESTIDTRMSRVACQADSIRETQYAKAVDQFAAERL